MGALVGGLIVICWAGIFVATGVLAYLTGGAEAALNAGLWFGLASATISSWLLWHVARAYLKAL